MTMTLVEINWAILTPLLIVLGLLILIALIDWFKTEATNGPKWVWLIVILVVSMLGPIIYFLVGRRD